MAQRSGRAGVEALARGLTSALGLPAGSDLAQAKITVDQLYLFSGRFSPRVAEALVRAGLDAPERLLFLDMAAIKTLPGIGPAARKEIEAYRARFLPVPGTGEVRS